jgi:hypothetical protein
VKINLIKTNDGSFIPCDEESQAKAKKFKAGVVHSHDVKVNQNYRLHSKLFGFFSFCTNYYYGDMEAYKDEYSVLYVRNKLTVIAGYFKQVYSRDGTSFELIPLSLKYESMEPEVRQEFYKKIVDAALNRVFDKTTDENVLNQLRSWF